MKNMTQILMFIISMLLSAFILKGKAAKKLLPKRKAPHLQGNFFDKLLFS